MSQPEIFRRCAQCGASSRPGELFCAQCGNALVADKHELPPEQIDLAEQHNEVAVTGQPQFAAESAGQSKAEAPAGGAEINAGAQPPPVAAGAGKSTLVQNPGSASRRAGIAARGMAGRVKPSTDKLRRVSSVVLDEAAYDPSIRFILVVGVLFVLFIVLLLLSKWIV
jgi:hypothetical protein